MRDRAGSMPPMTVGRQQPVGHVHVPGRVEAAYADTDQLDRDADPRGQVVALLGEQPDHLGPDRAAAEHGHLE